MAADGSPYPPVSGDEGRRRLSVVPSARFDIVDLVAEGDAVVARYTSEITLATGKRIDGRGLTYYRLSDGKIVLDDPIETPDLTQELAALMPPPTS